MTDSLASEPYSRLAGVYDEIVVDPSYALWAEFLHRLWFSDPAGVHRVLDVACGTGLLAEQLVWRGFQVTGVDSSQSMLDRACRRLGDDVDLIRATLPDLPVEGAFDAAVSTFDGLNYLSPAALAATLTAVSRRLRAGGWLVFDLHTDAMLDFTVANPVVAGESDGNCFVITSEVDVAARTVATRINVTSARTGEPFSEVHEQYFHSDDTVRAALADAGFEVSAVLDEYTDASADADTLRATWVARRPA